MGVVIPFSLNLLATLDNGTVSEIQAVECVEAVESYLFRRWSCGIPTNSLNKVFEKIHEEWRDRIANLTITAYNSEYSNRDFAKKRDMENGFADSVFRMNKWVGEQETWGERELESRQSMLEGRFIKLWPSISTSYQPTREVPDEATLGDDTEFTGRDIVSYSFMGDDTPVKTWKEMEVGVLRSLCDLDLGRLYTISEESSFPGSAFEHEERQGYSKVSDGLFVKSSTSTWFKIELLKRLFELLDVDKGELLIKMTPGS
jgi:hypothetical protein